MTKDVLVTIKGIQTDMMESDEIEIVTPGQYVEKNKKVYITYMDATIDQDKETKTTIKLSEDQVSVLRFGAVNTHMVFEKNKAHITHYETPYGVFEINTLTQSIDVSKGEDFLDIDVAYSLSINHLSMGNNTFSVKVKNAGSKGFFLTEDTGVCSTDECKIR